MGEIPLADVVAGRNAEGETPGGRGKLSGKRTVTPCILWREPVKGPPKGKAQSLRAEGNLSGKRTGEFRNIPELPCFFLGCSIMTLVEIVPGIRPERTTRVPMNLMLRS
jgi:hypothetical protein